MSAAAPAGVLDAHVHFWNPATLEYPWLATVPALGRTFQPEDYAAAARGVAVTETLFVEANCREDQAAGEVAYAEGLSCREPRIGGIVAFAELTDEASLEATLDARAGHPLVRGIRQNVQGRMPGFALQAAFVRGVQEVGRRGLAFDLCVTHDQLGEAEALVRQAPGTRCVLDHCGKPGIRDGVLDPWRGDLARLAAHPNVWCKLSGLLTEAGPGWTSDALAPYVDHVVACFGTDRVIYGSDWPVLTLVGALGDWYDFTERYTAGWSAAERSAFYGDTARRAYRLPSSGA